jgi:5-carboxymethyl-2-hydroxymuconate isomerase
MPHLVILYTPNLEDAVDMSKLCRSLADTMLTVRDEVGKQVFPTGGVRVLAYPAQHYALADGGTAGRAAGGSGEYGFMYLNLRMGRGRSAEVKLQAGTALKAAAMAHLQPLLDTRPVGVTLQIDEGQEVFDSKNSSLHPLFKDT